jgi:aspartate kinase
VTVTDIPIPLSSIRETEFEKRRGISRMEIRRGFAQVHVLGLAGDLHSGRLEVLRAIAIADISIDFLKLTPSGLSFLISNEVAEQAGYALREVAERWSLQQDRAIVLVHAVNIRDEEGMIARIVSAAIASGITLEHIGDMHDRMLMVVAEAEAEKLLRALADLAEAEGSR